MKRGVFVVVMLCLCIGMVFGQGKREDQTAAVATEQIAGGLVAEKGAVIKFVHWNGSPSDEAAWNVVLEKFRKDHPEIELKVEAFPSSSYVQQLDTMIAGNQWPDVMRYTYQRLGKFKEANLMLDITPYISKVSVDDLVPAYRQALTSNGKLVGMPHHTDTIALFYNKDMFEKSNIRIPQNADDGWSWDELKEYSRILKRDNNLNYTFAGIWENRSGYRYLPFVYMNGGTLFNEDGTRITIDEPKALEALQLYADLRAENLVANTPFTQTAQNNMLFVAKKLAFVFAGSWHCSYMEENMPGNWGVTYMPQVNGKTTSDMGGNGLFAYKNTKYPKAAAIFIDYLTNPENMKLFCETGNFLPVRQSLINEGLDYQSFAPEMAVFSNIISTIDEKMATDETSNRFQQVNVIFSDLMDYIAVNASLTPSQVAAEMKKQMQEVLDE
ncbi:MAG: sugar ABC transporter substrate-binding protein [Candidatus Methanomethylophilaceae archaeon]|jgi:ABC-type glycerol-3-phosphate transport system substrate-binding protein